MANGQRLRVYGKEGKNVVTSSKEDMGFGMKCFTFFFFLFFFIFSHARLDRDVSSLASVSVDKDEEK